MLEILDKPTVVKADDRRPTKRVYLMGRADVVTAVAQQRGTDANCRQVKSCPEPHRLRVVYVLDGEEVVIAEVYLKVGDNWNCYYQHDAGVAKVGKKEAEVGCQVSYYLTEHQVEPIAALIKAYERRRAVRRLVRQGPDVFPRKRVD
jgi:hypothetical protein